MACSGDGGVPEAKNSDILSRALRVVPCRLKYGDVLLGSVAAPDSFNFQEVKKCEATKYLA